MKPLRADLKDVMLAILAASAALAGLVLVFSGFLISQYMALDPESTSDKQIGKLRNFARFGAAPFLFSVLSGGLSFSWLVSPWKVYYDLAVYSFEALGIVTSIYGLCAFFRLV